MTLQVEVWGIPDQPALGNVLAPIRAALGVGGRVVAVLIAAWQAATK